MRRQVAMLVVVELDDLPGTMHTEENALRVTQGLLNNCMHSYHPVVTKAPAELQPNNTEGNSNR